MNMQLKHYMAHIRDCHSYLPGFSIICRMYGCPQKFKTWNSFRTHVYEMHGSDRLITNQQQGGPQSVVNQQPTNPERDSNPENEITRWTAAENEGMYTEHAN